MEKTLTKRVFDQAGLPLSPLGDETRAAERENH